MLLSPLLFVMLLGGDLLAPPVTSRAEAEEVFGTISVLDIAIQTPSSNSWQLQIIRVDNPTYDQWLFSRNPRYKGHSKQQRALALLVAPDRSANYILNAEIDNKTLFLRFPSKDLDDSIMEFWMIRKSPTDFKMPHPDDTQRIVVDSLESGSTQSIDQIEIWGSSTSNTKLPDFIGARIEKSSPGLTPQMNFYWSVGKPNGMDEDLFWVDVEWRDKSGESLGRGGVFSTVSFISRYLTRRFGPSNEDMKFAFRFVELMDWLRAKRIGFQKPEDLQANASAIATAFRDYFEDVKVLDDSEAVKLFEKRAVDYFGRYRQALLANCASIIATYTFPLTTSVDPTGYFAYQFIHAGDDLNYPKHPIWLEPSYSNDQSLSSVILRVKTSATEFGDIPTANAAAPWRRLR